MLYLAASHELFKNSFADFSTRTVVDILKPVGTTDRERQIKNVSKHPSCLTSVRILPVIPPEPPSRAFKRLNILQASFSETEITVASLTVCFLYACLVVLCESKRVWNSFCSSTEWWNLCWALTFPLWSKMMFSSWHRFHVFELNCCSNHYSLFASHTV